MGPRFRGDDKESLSLDAGKERSDTGKSAVWADVAAYPRAALRFRGDDKRFP